MSEPNFIFLGIPHCGILKPPLLSSVLVPTSEHKVKIQATGMSILTHCFNQLWTDAWNTREEDHLTHFAMHHSDIGCMALPRPGLPPLGFLDVLSQDMISKKVQVVSAVSPIKNICGATSCGMYDPKTRLLYRLTMKEVWNPNIPAVFDTEDVIKAFPNFKDMLLVINTGVMFVDFRHDWIDDVCFQFHNKIIPDPKNPKKKIATVMPEDWNFSLYCHHRNVPIAATKRVVLVHVGDQDFSNQFPWGQWEHDKQNEIPYPPPILTNGIEQPVSVCLRNDFITAK